MKCPNCGYELRIIWINTKQHNKKYFLYYEGICRECGSLYEWYDIYKYEETSSLQQIKRL